MPGSKGQRSRSGSQMMMNSRRPPSQEEQRAIERQRQLNVAVAENNESRVRDALLAGAQVNTAGEIPYIKGIPRDLPAVHWAAYNGAMAAIEVLCEQGATLDAVGKTPPALFFAAVNNQVAAFNSLWLRGASRGGCKQREESLLHAAAESGSCAMIELIYRDDPSLFADLLDKKNFQGCTPLVYALIEQHEEAAFLLVHLGANVNCSEHASSSALHWALLMPQSAFLRMLLEHPKFDLQAHVAVPGAADWFEKYSLKDAALAGLTFSVDVMLTRILPNASATMLGNMLKNVCAACTTDAVVDIAALLVKHGAALADAPCDPRQGGGGFGFGAYVSGKRPATSALVGALRLKASRAAQSALVTLLLGAEADTSDTNVLVEACENACPLEIVQQLVAAGAPASDAAIFAAAKAGASAAVLDAIGDVLEPPFDVNTKDADGNSLLHFAQLGVDVLARLIDAGADLHARNRSGRTPLMVVAPEFDDEFSLLLARGADPNTAIPGEGGGYSVLHRAAALARPERVRRLLAAGANPNAKDGAHETPLFHAMDAESVRLLVAAQASTSALAGGRTPMVAALRKPAVLRALIAASGQVEPTLLHLCMRHIDDITNKRHEPSRKPESAESDELAALCAQVLIDAGADVHASHVWRGNSALHFAAQRANGRRSLLMLFNNGALADLERANEEGHTARDLADESCRGGRFRLDEHVNVAKHDGVLMLVAAGVVPLPTWVGPLSTPKARERIELFRFDLSRRRTTEIVVALQNLDISALELVHIVEAALGELPFALVWRLVTTVKHFKK